MALAPGADRHTKPTSTVAAVVLGATAAPSGLPDGVRLLPYFDAYSVGCFPREHVFPGRAAERALAGSDATSTSRCSGSATPSKAPRLTIGDVTVGPHA